MIIVFFTLGQDEQRFRLVINSNTGKPFGIETEARDHRGDISWRPASNVNSTTIESIMGRALVACVEWLREKPSTDKTASVYSQVVGCAVETVVQLGKLGKL